MLAIRKNFFASRSIAPVISEYKRGCKHPEGLTVVFGDLNAFCDETVFLKEFASRRLRSCDFCVGASDCVDLLPQLCRSSLRDDGYHSFSKADVVPWAKSKI